MASVLLLATCVGWGELVRRALRTGPVDLGLRGAWGLSALVVLGGPLNLAGWISRPLVLGLLAIGWAAAVWALAEAPLDRRLPPEPVDRPPPPELAARPNRRLSPLAAGLLLPCLVLVGLQLAVGDALPFNPHDDRHAYLVLPVQMLDAGGMLPDPFNLRRLISSLGGQSFLHALSLGLLRVDQLNALERGVALGLWLLLLAGHARRRGLDPCAALGLTLGLLLLHVPAVNVSSLLTGVVGFYGLLRTHQHLDDPAVPAARRIALLALVAAGLSALKTSLIPAAGVFLVAGAVASAHAPPRRRLLELAAVGALTAVGMLPWMLDLLRSSGTLLYPLFGLGTHGSLHGAYPAAYTEASLQVQLANMVVTFTEPLFAALALVAVLPLRGGHGWRHAKAGAVAACVTALILVVASDGRVRYSFPFAAAALSCLLVEALASRPQSGAPGWLDARRWGAAALVVVVAWSLPARLGELRAWPTQLVDRWRAGGEDRFAAERARLRAVQAQTPAGAPLFVRLASPFVLAYDRQPIAVLDWPCAASPPPGLSCALSPTEIAAYLEGRGYAALLYDQASEAGFSLAFGARLDADANYWERISAEHTYAFQDLLVELAAQRGVADPELETWVIPLRGG